MKHIFRYINKCCRAPRSQEAPFLWFPCDRHHYSVSLAPSITFMFALPCETISVVCVCTKRRCAKEEDVLHTIVYRGKKGKWRWKDENFYNLLKSKWDWCACICMQKWGLLLGKNVAQTNFSVCLISLIVIVLTHVYFVFKAHILCVCASVHFHHHFSPRLLFEPSAFIMCISLA